jgi:hypothetical protein
VKVTLLLADFAQVSEGKLNIIGGGWSVTGPFPVPSAVAAKIEVPWDQANKRHHVVLELKDEDGRPVLFPSPLDGDLKAVRVDADLEVGRPPGLTPGTPLDAPMAVNIGPMPLTPGKRYIWELSINDETHEDWRVPFSVRGFPPGFQPPPPGFPPPPQTF